ncbi:hypothetical protein SS1G_13724 [Sclerotinia sclerotiorum 1980 UF-70]|uniref:Zn(2)-C6 fungal-type domain-containing protein n=1 Tax=Sclerotinia sclerotiorum (strain ATCC 18683 / 1980 / Ss-1) TaxID=665079 RepID=A7F7Z4_SCLS1|nr:hypothetical protein SS1G_13724 [Sclerotinia sclerotiorum 1980 UF-70]EDN98865.1 hypothetical protein SS1G_13724 [Sclerotinia sclerotiorum 1980 UF-70]
MPSRRSHIKSHHGCSQCKLRRVKCDERQPVCSRCKAYKRECTYNSVISQAPGQHSFELRPPPVSKTQNHKPPLIRSSSRRNPPQNQNPLHSSQARILFGFHTEEDALLHHYVNVTARPMTSAFNRPDQSKWEGAVRRNASTHGMGWMKSLDSNLSVHLRQKVMRADVANTPAEGEEYLEQLQCQEIEKLKDSHLRDLYNDISFKVRQNLRRTQQFPGRVWPGTAPPAYIQCVKEREPIALVLVAYWAIGQDRGVGYNWWARNWARDLVETIGEELEEDSRWGLYMRWPREKMGLV